MVFDNTFSPNEETPKQAVKIASVNDRFLAFVFDVVIFTPVISFFLVTVLRHIELLYYTSPMSFEFMALVGVCAAMATILAVLFQTIFLLLFQATPGKLFLKMRVVSLHGSAKLSFSQALVRSTVWALEFFLLALPFLEVVSHQWRRALHDRAADTMVMTLKAEGDHGPHFLEAQFIRQMLLAVGIFALTWGIFFSGNVYRMALSGDFKRTQLEKDMYFCGSVNEAVVADDNRMDVAAALFLADQIPAECLEAEADFHLWTLSEEKKAWAYYAKFLLTEKTDYQGQVCAMSSELCDLSAGKLESVKKLPDFKGTKTLAVLNAKKYLQDGKLDLLTKELEDLDARPSFKEFVQSLKVKMYWTAHNKDQARAAFDTIASHLAPSQSASLSAWLCHEELDEGCSQKNYPACSVLRKQTAAMDKIENLPVALALVRESQCKGTALNYVQVEDVFLGSQLAQKLLRAMDSRSGSPEGMRKSVLLGLAVDAKDDVINEVARAAIFSHALDKKDIKQLKQYLKDKTVKNLSWQKLYAKTLRAAMKANDKENMLDLVGFVSDSEAEQFRMKESLGLAAYQVEDYQKAWRLLKSEERSSRTPASEALLPQVRTELKKRFGEL